MHRGCGKAIYAKVLTFVAGLCPVRFDRLRVEGFHGRRIASRLGHNPRLSLRLNGRTVHWHGLSVRQRAAMHG